MAARERRLLLQLFLVSRLGEVEFVALRSLFDIYGVKVEAVCPKVEEGEEVWFIRARTGLDWIHSNLSMMGIYVPATENIH